MATATGSYPQRIGLARDLGTGRATGGVVGIFAAFGLGIALLALLAAYAVGDAYRNDVSDFTGGISAAALAALPLVATPFLAVIAGVWAGTATRSGGRGALAAVLGTLLGAILMFALIGAGIALGAAAGGTDVSNVQTVDLSDNLTDQLRFIGSVAGLAYLLANLLIAAVAGAIIGAIMPRALGAPRPVEERVVDRDDRPVRI